MTTKAQTWLLLIVQLPGHNPAVRMQVWRALKARGVGQLRDGAYLLPNSDDARKVFAIQQTRIEDSGGKAYTMSLEAESTEQEHSFIELFDRTSDYAAAIDRLAAFKHGLAKARESVARQTLAAINREVAVIAARDFFPNRSRDQIDAALADAEESFNAKFVPDEPHASSKTIKVLDRQVYQGKTWTTRERLWIDRVASAWLIRRFIDPSAQFVWIKKGKTPPKRAIGFDFDDAEFTHVGSKVTFEVLLASFGLEQDPALLRLAALVHYLDVGGIPVAEGPGFTAIMTGVRLQHDDDHALLATMSPVLDSLHAAYVPLI